MKALRKLCTIGIAGVCVLTLGACGGKSAYSDYSSAYKKMSEPGSLDVKFALAVDDGSQTVNSSGDMKMNSSNEVYYEMTINGKDIVQYVKDGQVHTIVDGDEQLASTNDKDKGVQKPDADNAGESNEKTDSTGFNSEKFLEEFSGMLEAGKIKEMGVLDPIPQKYISEITSSKSGSDTVYTMTFPDEFLKTLLNAMISEQTEDSGTALSFDALKDFECVAKENSDGYLYAIEYKGYTTVTVPAEYVTSGSDETFDLNIDLNMEIQNPGTAVEVVIPE